MSVNVKELSLEELKEILTNELKSIFEKKEFHGSLSKQKKADGTVVTRIDLLVSRFIEDRFAKIKALDNYHFLSEEKPELHSQLSFPCLALDPIDGTRELSAGIGECCVSLGLLPSSHISNTTSWAWLFNPFTGFELSSDQTFYTAPQLSRRSLLGLISRSEFEQGLYASDKPKHYINLVPKGSIAFKLGLLAAGSCDFVVTKKPKNLWDIAAGTVLCAQRGIYLYNEKGLIQEWELLNSDQFMLWCRPELHEELSEVFRL